MTSKSRSKIGLITRRGVHRATLQLELDSCNHVISVLSQQVASPRKTQEHINKEIDYYKAIREDIINKIFEDEILVGEEDDATS